MSAEPHPDEGRLAGAQRRLQSLAESERGVPEVIALGTPTIPALRMIAFTPEPSGLYQLRTDARGCSITGKIGICAMDSIWRAGVRVRPQ
jgi:hypothetical protein